MKSILCTAAFAVIFATAARAQFVFDLGGHLPSEIVASVGGDFALGDVDGDGDLDLLHASG